MNGLRNACVSITKRVHGLLERARVWLDGYAEKEKGRWGAHMEYRRRYTNPDDAKRSRAPPDAPRT